MMPYPISSISEASVTQNIPNEKRELPQYLERSNGQQYEREEDFAEYMQRGFWPVSCWVILLGNTLIAWTAIAGAWQTGYNPAHHFFMTATFGLTIAILAFIHKYILRK